MNSQHEKTHSKGNFVLKTGLNVRFKDFWYTKINQSQKYILKNLSKSVFIYIMLKLLTVFIRLRTLSLHI